MDCWEFSMPTGAVCVTVIPILFKSPFMTGRSWGLSQYIILSYPYHQWTLFSYLSQHGWWCAEYQEGTGQYRAHLLSPHWRHWGSSTSAALLAVFWSQRCSGGWWRLSSGSCPWEVKPDWWNWSGPCASEEKRENMLWTPTGYINYSVIDEKHGCWCVQTIALNYWLQYIINPITIQNFPTKIIAVY